MNVQRFVDCGVHATVEDSQCHINVTLCSHPIVILVIYQIHAQCPHSEMCNQCCVFGIQNPRSPSWPTPSIAHHRASASGFTNSEHFWQLLEALGWRSCDFFLQVWIEGLYLPRTIYWNYTNTVFVGTACSECIHPHSVLYYTQQVQKTVPLNTTPCINCVDPCAVLPKWGIILTRLWQSHI